MARAFSCLPAPLEWVIGGESVTPAYTSAPQLNGSGLCPGDVVGAWGGGELEEQRGQTCFHQKKKKD